MVGSGLAIWRDRQGPTADCRSTDDFDVRRASASRPIPPWLARRAPRAPARDGAAALTRKLDPLARIAPAPGGDCVLEHKSKEQDRHSEASATRERFGPEEECGETH